MKILKNFVEDYIIKKYKIIDVKYKLSDKVFVKLGTSNVCIIPHEITESEVFRSKNDLFKISYFKTENGFILSINKVEEYE